MPSGNVAKSTCASLHISFLEMIYIYNIYKSNGTNDRNYMTMIVQHCMMSRPTPLHKIDLAMKSKACIGTPNF